MSESTVGLKSIEEEVKIYEQLPESIIEMVKLMHKAVTEKDNLYGRYFW